MYDRCGRHAKKFRRAPIKFNFVAVVTRRSQDFACITNYVFKILWVIKNTPDYTRMSDTGCCKHVLQEVQKYFIKIESRLKNVEEHLEIMQWIMIDGDRKLGETSKDAVEKNKEISMMAHEDPTTQNTSVAKTKPQKSNAILGEENIKSTGNERNEIGMETSITLCNTNDGFINATHGSTSQDCNIVSEQMITGEDSGVSLTENNVTVVENDCEVIESDTQSVNSRKEIPVQITNACLTSDINLPGHSKTNKSSEQNLKQNSVSGKRKASSEETESNENENADNEQPVAKQSKADDLDTQTKKAVWSDIFRLLQPEYSNEITWRLLLQACIEGLPVVVSFLLEMSPTSRHEAYFTKKNEAGYSLLTLAAQAGHRDVVKVLVDTGINLLHGNNIEALLEAAVNGHVGVVEILIRAGVNPCLANKLGSSALHLAARGGHVQVITELIRARANPSARDELGRTPLHEAAIAGDADCVNTLLNEKINKEAKDQSGYTALHYAAERNHTMIIEALISARVNVYACDAEGRTALHTAAVAGSVGAIEILMKDIHNLAYDRRGRTALHLAAKAGQIEAVELLLPTIYYVGYDKDGLYPVHCAARLGNTEIIDILLCAGENASKRDCIGRTPLHHAVDAGCIKTVRLLLSEDSNVDAQDTYGRTPLHQAADRGNEEITWALLDGGACAFSCDNLYYSPLHYAAKAGHCVVMKALMGAGASPEVQRYKETPTPLQLAVTHNHPAAVKVLLESGAKPANKEMLDSLQQLLPEYDWSDYNHLK